METIKEYTPDEKAYLKLFTLANKQDYINLHIKLMTSKGVSLSEALNILTDGIKKYKKSK